VILEVHGLRKTYKDIVAVDSMDLTLDRGEILAVAGPDGAGKTSLFRALAGLIGFDAGEATIAGHDVRTSYQEIKPLLGYMPQSFSLYPDLSVEENLRFYAGLFGIGGSVLKERKQRLYEFSGLGQFRDRRAGQLSGGMKQKLALSCALVHEPRLLILDEPTTGVDPLSRRQFWDILATLRGSGSAILVSTPYMDEVESADRAVLVHHGRTLATGTPEELARRFRGLVFRLRGAASTALMSALQRIEGVQARRFGSSVRLFTGEGYSRSRMQESLRALDIAGEVESAQPVLEDVFIQMMES